MYNYRWSFSLVLTVVLRIFGGAFVMFVFFGIIATLLTYAGTNNWSQAVMVGPYFVGFSMMLISCACLPACSHHSAPSLSICLAFGASDAPASCRDR
jgi:hypothetical protein